MIPPVRVERLHGDFSRTLYRFCLIDSAVCLDEVIEESRKTRRHTWRGRTVYSRLYRTVKVEPIVPEDVSAEAVSHFRNQIHFKKSGRLWLPD